jgi:uncharacterized repeat protein (TIGR01451 family)
MPANVATRSTAAANIACALLLLAGCQGFRLPAIDPTGQYIFAPGQTTTLDTSPRCALFQPAFTTPPTPPICTDIAPGLPPTIPPSVVMPGPSVVGPTTIQPQPTITMPGPTTPGRRGSIMLTPTEMIAPVGSEVVLRAGLCGEDGYYVTGQPVEFMLGNESVGHLVAVGDDERSAIVRHIAHDRTAERRTDSFAIGRTATNNLLLDRGTAGREDDIQLLAGQTWVSVTSGGAGISRVTAVAPNAKNWDGRFQTATIRWIDAQWSPPPPAISRSGAQHNLTTTVTRSSDGTPLVGWTVRYEVVDGPPAQFVSPDGRQGGAAADATTDSNGAASVLIAPTSNQPGTTRVRMQIFQPASPDGTQGAVSVGQAFTSVTWSAPGLAANIVGPQQASAGETINYHIEISNPGDITVNNVVVTHVLPPEVSYLGSNPPGNVFGNRLEWRLPRVDPGMVVALDVSVSVEAGGDLAHVVTAQSDEGLAAEATAITRVLQNALLLLVEGPQSGRVGEQAQFHITLTNTSNQTLTGVIVTDELGPGLAHETGVSRIERAIGQLGPQQAFDFAVTLTITQAGELCQMLSATADGGHFASARSCLQVAVPAAPSGPVFGQPAPEPATPTTPITPIPPATPAAPGGGAPEITVTVNGPGTAVVGQIAQFQIIVNNTGGLPLTNVRIISRIDPEMVPSLATPGFFPAEGGGIFWSVKELPAGHLVTINVHARCDRMADRACERVTVEMDQLPVKEAEACLAIGAQQGRREMPEVPVRSSQTNIAHRPQEPTPAETVDDPNARSSEAGQLEISIATMTSPVVVGAPVTYVVQIHNARSVADQDIALRLDLPTALRFERLLAGPVDGQTVSGNGKTVVFRPVREIRPDETITFRILLRSERSGRVAVTSQTTSRRQVAPATASTVTAIQ